MIKDRKIRDYSRKDYDPWKEAYKIIPIVGPRGEFMIYHAERPTESRGRVPVILHQGKVVLQPSFAEKGWVLYEDFCYGRVPGVEADMAKWQIWENYVRYRASGKIPGNGTIPAKDFFHEEVLRRRERDDGPNVGNVEEVTAFLFGSGQGLVSDDVAEIFATEETPKKKGKK